MEEIIKKTKDYDQFKYMNENRKTDINHINELVSSISKENLLDCNPIIVDSEMYIYDGQHRLEAARILNIPIYYKTKENLKLEDIYLLNNTSRKWVTDDWMNFYTTQGKEEYIKLNKMLYKYKLTLSNALVWCCHGERKHVLFKQGLFKMDMDETVYKAFLAWFDIKSFLKENKILPKQFFNDKTLNRSIKSFLTNSMVDVDRFVKQIETNTFKFRKCSNHEEYFELFVDIYNYHKQSNRLVAVKKGCRSSLIPD